MSRWFVTGTDTDVGKSVATACLAQAARDWGTVCAAKPTASGVAPGTAGEDATLIASAAGHEPRVFATYEPPVSPHRAILDGGAPLDVDALRRWVVALEADTVLVEGVGGWRVPLQLDPRAEVPDLARWADGPVILVAADRLGVLSHTRLTVDAIRQDGLELAGVVLSAVPGTPRPGSTLDDLRRLTDVPVVELPSLDVADAAQRRAAGRALWRSLWPEAPCYGPTHPRSETHR